MQQRQKAGYGGMMSGLQTLRIHPKKVLERLEEFEMFCLGEADLTPEHFRTLNRELSINAVLHIGKHHIENEPDGKHLIWVAPDRRRHDLGALSDINVFRDYPGFHRTRSLSLDHDQVQETEIFDIPTSNRRVTIVRMKDGSAGVGPDYKIALRNAALKMHLKRAFERSNPLNLWKIFYGHA